MKVYLSGPIGPVTFEEASGWRRDVTDRLQAVGIQTIDPMRGRQEGLSWREQFGTPQALVRRDLADIDASDLVLIHIPTGVRGLVGTICEIWEASSCEKPTILVCDDPYYTNHPWILVACAQIFPTFDAAIEYIVKRWRDDDEEALPEVY